ncbi:transcriptional enhancer factor TEF-3 isoform 5 [Camelus ferus]|nr:transcriptional enhancer factor TEF-3 isoform 5 [Camelus ferus]
MHPEEAGVLLEAPSPSYLLRPDLLGCAVMTSWGSHPGLALVTAMEQSLFEAPFSLPVEVGDTGRLCPVPSCSRGQLLDRQEEGPAPCGADGPTGAPPSGALEGKAGTITSNEWSSPNSPEGSNVSGGSQALDKPIDNDAEGVWSPDIEQSFQEALAIYPPCGRRKIILSDEGKMYARDLSHRRGGGLRRGSEWRSWDRVRASCLPTDSPGFPPGLFLLALHLLPSPGLHSLRSASPPGSVGLLVSVIQGPAYRCQERVKTGRNELIARYIKLRTGKTRTRKQVSSHIQVLARRKAREIQAKLKDQAAKDKALQSMATLSSAQIISATAFHSKMALARGPGYPAVSGYNKHLFVHIGQSSPSYSDPYLEAVDIRQIYDKFPEKKGGLKELFERGPSNAFFLVKFWADLNTNIEDEGSSFYGVSSQYESPENMIITCSTKVCSFGKQVVEKVETEYARYENGHYSYRIHRSPLCEYMINFIHKLKHLPEKYMMNSVVTNRDTQETLLCVAYVFEVSASEHGAQHHIYRLVKE